MNGQAVCASCRDELERYAEPPRGTVPLAEISGFINLFNLMPIWQLDGARGFHALTRQQRAIGVAAIAVARWLTAVPILWIVGAVAVYSTLRATPGPGHVPTAAMLSPSCSRCRGLRERCIDAAAGA